MQLSGPYLKKIKRCGDPQAMEDWIIISGLRTGHAGMSQDFGGGSFHRTCENCGANNSAEHIVCVGPTLQKFFYCSIT